MSLQCPPFAVSYAHAAQLAQEAEERVGQQLSFFKLDPQLAERQGEAVARAAAAADEMLAPPAAKRKGRPAGSLLAKKPKTQRPSDIAAANMLDTFRALIEQVRKDGWGASDDVEQGMDRELLLRRAERDLPTAERLCELADTECNNVKLQKRRAAAKEKREREKRAKIRETYKEKQARSLTAAELELKRKSENRKRGERAAAARLAANPALAERRARLALRRQQTQNSSATD